MPLNRNMRRGSWTDVLGGKQRQGGLTTARTSKTGIVPIAPPLQHSSTAASPGPFGMVGSAMHGLHRTLSAPPARASLRRYVDRGGGADLFDAYFFARRFYSVAKEREKELAERLGKPLQMEPQDFLAAAGELDMLTVLDALDPLIDDLIRVCADLEAGRLRPRDAQLARLRKALRIDVGRAPTDSARERKKKKIVGLWFSAYCEMERSGRFRSENSIADEIAVACDIVRRTAINYWTENKQDTAWLNPWTAQIAQNARSAQKQAKRTPVTPPVSTGKASKLRRLEYGKKRAA